MILESDKVAEGGWLKDQPFWFDEALVELLTSYLSNFPFFRLPFSTW